MPQKKSSQLYSVSPKTHLRLPKKKRKRSLKIFSFSLLATILIGLIAGVAAYYYVTGSSIVSPLPVAIGEKVQLTRSQKTEDEVKRLLDARGIMYTAVVISGSDVLITLSTKQQVLLTKKKDIGEQISSLQVILPRLTMKGSEFRTIDLRFDRPVVTN